MCPVALPQAGMANLIFALHAVCAVEISTFLDTASAEPFRAFPGSRIRLSNPMLRWSTWRMPLAQLLKANRRDVTSVASSRMRDTRILHLGSVPLSSRDMNATTRLLSRCHAARVKQIT